MNTEWNAYMKASAWVACNEKHVCILNIEVTLIRDGNLLYQNLLKLSSIYKAIRLRYRAVC